MDEYKVSAINTHACPTLIYLSKSSDGVTWDTMLASELKSGYTNSNGMALIVGCDSFTATGSGTWADATSKANVRGGTTSEWPITYVRDFTNKYFTAMANGYTASAANSYASSNGANPKLKLIGNTGFKLEWVIYRSTSFFLLRLL
jgi:hypothetical protein